MADHIARASMLIRRPVADVFDAFVNPATITKFWLQSTTGPLAKEARVSWRFMVPGATATVTVTAFEDKKRIAFEWSDGNRVNMVFEARGNGALGFPTEAVYRDWAAFRELKTTLESVNESNPFPPDTWLIDGP